MNRLIITLHEVLNLIKGFESMYSSKRADRMIIKHEGKSYLVKVELISDRSNDSITIFKEYLE